MDVHGNRFEQAELAKRFMLGGNARVTLKSAKTGHHYTFRVRRSQDGEVYFVGILADGDNEHGYVPLGIITRQWLFKLLRKTTFRETSPSFVAFHWMWSHLQAGKIPTTVEFWHEGSCGLCGRPLTDPTSIEQGFGPECIHHVR